MNLRLIAAILRALFHGTQSVSRAGLAYLLDAGSKKGQPVFACSPRQRTCP